MSLNMKSNRSVQHEKGQSDEVRALETTSTSNKHTRPMLHDLPKTPSSSSTPAHTNDPHAIPAPHAESSLTVALISKNTIHTILSHLSLDKEKHHKRTLTLPVVSVATPGKDPCVHFVRQYRSPTQALASTSDSLAAKGQNLPRLVVSAPFSPSRNTLT